MEDHLKNKDRLDKEWGALCAYEADPCSTAIAEKVSFSARSKKSLKTIFASIFNNSKLL